MKVWNLFLVTLALLVLIETLMVSAADDAQEAKKQTKTKAKKSAKKSGQPKIRRTVRIKESEPADEEPPKAAPAVAAKPAEQATPPQQIELSNTGPSNQIEVKPNISIGQPAPASEPIVKAAADEKDDEPEDEVEEEEEKDKKKREEKLQIVPYVPKEQQENLELAKQSNNTNKKLDLNSNNLVQNLLANSGNQHHDLAQNSNNRNSRVLSNVGNTETIHIDGVGNNKSVKISNVGNTHQAELENVNNNNNSTNETSRKEPTVLAQPNQQIPFVQINMNGLMDRLMPAQQPIVVQSPPFMPPQPAQLAPIQMPMGPWTQLTKPAALIDSQLPVDPLLLNQKQQQQYSYIPQVAAMPGYGQMAYNQMMQWPNFANMMQTMMPTAAYYGAPGYPAMPFVANPYLAPQFLPFLVQPPVVLDYTSRMRPLSDFKKMKKIHKKQIKQLKKQLEEKETTTTTTTTTTTPAPSVMVVKQAAKPEEKGSYWPSLSLLSKREVPTTTTTTTTPKPIITTEKPEEIEWETIRVPKRKTKKD